MAEANEMTKAESEAMKAQWSSVGRDSGLQFWAITAYDMAQCPVRSLWPHHYRRDGGCRCDELAAAQVALEEATTRYLQRGSIARHDYLEARFEVQACGGELDD